MQQHTVDVDRRVSPTALAYSPVFNVAVAFIDRHLAQGRADKVAIRTLDEDVTYAQLAERVNRVGNVLKSLEIAPAGRILMVVKDCPEFVYLFFGAIKAGRIPAPVNTMLRPEDYRFLIEDSECALLVHGPEFSGVIDGALSEAGHRPASVMVTTGSGGLRERMAGASAELAPAPATADADCFWLYSSGSTGNPKGVVHAHRDMVTTSQRYGLETAGLHEDDVCFSASKLFHSYGFGNAMTFPLWAGATLALSDRRVSPEMTFEIIERFRPSVFFGVPTLYAQQLRAMENSNPDLSSLRLCVSAGEALPGDVLRRWKERTGTLILDGLGSTENLHIFISNTPADYRPGTSGRVVPGYEVCIVDEDGKAVQKGELGTVHVKGESAAKYYWKNPEKTARTMLGEWLNSGDMYYQDNEDYYVNAGRGDDMFKVGGLWCSPFEIEARLIEHAKVLEAAIVGRADEDGLIKPEAHVVLNDRKDASDALGEELREHCRAGLAHYKYPRWCNFVDDLPKTATGKIQRFRLREGS